MSIISANIRYLRKQRGLTQGELAEKVDITRSVVGSYEEGRAEPKLDTLQNIANFFGISLDQLVKVDLSEVAEATIQGKPLPGSNPDIEGKKLRVLSITVDKDDNENIELVPQKAAAGYLNGYADPEYLEELPKFHLPMLPQGTYRAFELTGDSMLPLTPGTIVIGEYVENWRDIRSGDAYILLSSSEGVVFKRVYNNVSSKGVLSLHSDNPVYSPFEVEMGDVLEVWKARAHISMDFPDGELSLQRLAGIVMGLQQEVIQMKKR